MKIDRVFLDMDGVLVDFIGGVARLFDATVNQMIARWTAGDYNMHPALGCDSERPVWDRINALREDFWAFLHPYPWASGLFELCESVAPVTILTSPSRDSRSASGKIQWLESFRGPGFRDYVIAPAKLKHLLARPGCVLIDDRDDNCHRWARAGGISITFPRHWNSLHELQDAPIKHVAYELARAKAAIDPPCVPVRK